MIRVRKYYTTGEVAKKFSVSIPTVQKWCRDGDLEHATTPGGHRRIFPYSVDGLLKTFYLKNVGKKGEKKKSNEH